MENLINLTPPIDGVQYGYNDEQIKEGDWMWNQWKGTFEGCFGIAGKTWHKSMKKVICCTNPTDIRFPYLVMPSKEQEVDLSFAIWYSGMEKAKVQSAYKRFVKETGYINPAKYTQEQMEKAIFQAKLGTQLTVTERYSGEDGVDNLTKDILQSIQPTAKAVVVEMEDSDFDYIATRLAGKPMVKPIIKVETSSKHSQGIVRAIEVIY